MEKRQSRMDKYFELEEIKNNEKSFKNDNGGKSFSRTKRNQELYKSVSTMDIEGFDLNSNTTILGDNTSNIDIEKINKQLEEKYHETPRNKSFGDTDEINLPKINLDETREYDINAILEKAKSEKEINYEEDRHRKVSDVLKDIEEYTEKVKSAKDEVPEEEDDELQTLVDTINAKELIDSEEELEVSGEMDPLDLLSDLKGDDDNTKVLGQLTEEDINNTIEVEDTDDVEDDEEDEEEEDEEEEFNTRVFEAVKKLNNIDEEESVDEEEELSKEALALIEDSESSVEEVEIHDEEEENPKKKRKQEEDAEDEDKLDKSFVGTTTFTREDYDDFDDLKEDMKITKVIIKILIVIIILVFIAGLVVLLNSKFNWGLF